MKYLLLLLLPFYVHSQNRISAIEILDRLNAEEAVTLKDYIIDGNLDLTMLENRQKTNRGIIQSLVVSPLYFENCSFEGDLVAYTYSQKENIMQKANFDSKVTFINCTFKGDFQAKYSTFYESLNLEGSIFEQETNFKYAEFKSEVIFGNTTFGQTANFKYASFSRDADFYHTNYKETADFKYSKFLARATFKKATFDEFADFKFTEFSENAIFNQVNFHRFSDFKYTSGELKFCK